MGVIFANRKIALRPRIVATDAHGDRYAAGYEPAGGAYPGLAEENPDVPLGQPGGRTWTIQADAALWPVAQQDCITDTGSGEMWQVTSAQLMINTMMPQLNHVNIEARLYTPGEGSAA